MNRPRRDTPRISYRGQARVGTRHIQHVNEFDDDHIVRDAPRANSLPQFTYRVERFDDGLPHVIEIRAVQRGGQDRHDDGTIFATLADTLRETVVRVVRSHLRWHSNRVRDHLRGTLYATDIHTGNAANDNDELRSRVALLHNLNREKMEILMGILNESARNITIYDIEWRFVIDPNSLRVGA